MTLLDDSHDQTLTLPVTHGAPARWNPATLVADGVSAWFGDHQVLDDVTLTMPAGRVTALIGPSGCGKSTFLRILNRMHELVPGAAWPARSGSTAQDIYDPARRPIESRRRIGMVFQKANPFPTMSIHDNVLAGPGPDRPPAARPRGRRPGRAQPAQRRPVGRGARPGSTPPAPRCRAASSSGSASPAPSPCGPTCC